MAVTMADITKLRKMSESFAYGQGYYPRSCYGS